jgi:predicted Zn-dependent protease
VLDYSLGEADSRFGISDTELQSAVAEAIAIWEQALNKKLFNQIAEGGLQINLSYDYRQEATDKLKTLGLSINDDQASYDTLKQSYEASAVKYEQQKKELDNLIKVYNLQKASYESSVNAVNNRGGANNKEARDLREGLQSLNNLATAIQQKQSQFNQTVDELNALATVTNKLIKDLNLTVDNYNQIGESVGSQVTGEFQEGLYISGSEGEEIVIYQFDDHQALVEVLAHELGHALGLEHLDNPQAIMYRLNESGNATITSDDINALKKVCQMK